MSSSKKRPRTPEMPDPRELIALQAEYNRVNVDTPFGSQTYVPGPNGSTTLRTDIGPLGQALVGRGVDLGMTNSARQSIDPRVEAIAGALGSRIGDRFGLSLGSDAMQLAPPAAMPQQQAKPQPQTPANPSLPQAPTQGWGVGSGSGPNPLPFGDNQRLQDLIRMKVGG